MSEVIKYCNLLCRRFCFGVPLEDICPPNHLHPELFEFAINCLENVPLEEALSCDDFPLIVNSTKYYQSLREIPKRKDQCLSIIKYFFIQLPIPAFPSNVRVHWKVINSKLLFSGRDLKEINQIITWNFLYLTSLNFLLLQHFFGFLRKLIKMKSLTRSEIFHLSQYFSYSLFSTPFKFSTRFEDYSVLLYYLILKWPKLLKMCRTYKTFNYVDQITLYEEDITFIPTASSDFNPSDIIDLDIEEEKVEMLFRNVLNITSKSIATQTDNQSKQAVFNFGCLGLPLMTSKGIQTSGLEQCLNDMGVQSTSCQTKITGMNHEGSFEYGWSSSVLNILQSTMKLLRETGCQTDVSISDHSVETIKLHQDLSDRKDPKYGWSPTVFGLTNPSPISAQKEEKLNEKELKASSNKVQHQNTVEEASHKSVKNTAENPRIGDIFISKLNFTHSLPKMSNMRRRFFDKPSKRNVPSGLEDFLIKPKEEGKHAPIKFPKFTTALKIKYKNLSNEQ